MKNTDIDWSHELDDTLSDHQQDWLQRPGSLTKHLQALGTFSLEVVDEGYYPAGHEDAVALSVDQGTPLWVRTVIMSVDGRPAVPARSATTVDASYREWDAARRQHDHPLGQILYNDPRITRSPFSWIELRPTPPHRSLLGDLVFHHPRMPTVTTSVWARRSLFHRDGAPLLIAEAFLNDFWERLAHEWPQPSPRLDEKNV